MINEGSYLAGAALFTATLGTTAGLYGLHAHLLDDVGSPGEVTRREVGSSAALAGFVVGAVATTAEFSSSLFPTIDGLATRTQVGIVGAAAVGALALGACGVWNSWKDA